LLPRTAPHYPRGMSTPTPAQVPALQPGDVVQLKSGGPKMTVGKPSSGFPNEFFCYWLDPAGALHEKSIPVAALTKSDSSAPASTG